MSTNPSQCELGIDPRAFQELTVDGSTRSVAATCPVPSEVRISETEVGMTPTIVGRLPIRQVLAELQSPERTLVGEMQTNMDSVIAIARRLIQTRLALGFEEQAEFCRQIGVDKTVYNPFEKGRRRISLDVAVAIRERFGIPLDWTFCGDGSRLPAEVYEKLRKAA
jgi:DNA-binding XRE family transcriptional regulator